MARRATVLVFVSDMSDVVRRPALPLPSSLPTRSRTDIGEGSLINPGVTLPGVVAGTRFELLQEADHPGRAELAAERFESPAADVIKRLWHRRCP